MWIFYKYFIGTIFLYRNVFDLSYRKNEDRDNEYD